MPLLHLSLFVSLISFVAAQQNVQFNQVVNLNGNMQLNSFVFPDNSKIETFSQSQRQLLVNQNPAPLSANHVVGSTGQPFVQLSQNSMTISTNGATDLVGAQIEMPIPQTTLDSNGVTADNTFVAKLSPDGQAWMVMETIKSVNTTDSTVRLIKMNNLDGEYMAIGRKTVETSNVLTPFGGPSQRSVNITGTGFQEVEFADGFRMSIKANMPMFVSTDVVNGISSSMLPGTSNMAPVNNYRYLVTTNLAGVAPNLNKMMTVVQLPLNANRLMSTAMSMGIGANDTIQLGIAQRGVLQNPGGSSTQGGTLQPQKRQKKASSSSSTKTSKATAKASATESSGASKASATETEAASATMGSEAGGNTTESSSSSSSATSTSSAGASAASAASDPTTTQGGGSTSNNPSNTQNQNPAATQLLLSPTFTPVTSKTVLDTANSRIAAPVSQLDGEYILTMSKASVGSASEGGNKGGVRVTIAELKMLMEMQANMGVLPVWQMMTDFQNQNGGGNGNQGQGSGSSSSASETASALGTAKYRRGGPRRLSRYLM